MFEDGSINFAPLAPLPNPDLVKLETSYSSASDCFSLAWLALSDIDISTT